MTLQFWRALACSAASLALLAGAGLGSSGAALAATGPVQPASAASTTRVIHAGRMLDVRSGKMLRDMYISLVDGRITAVSGQAPANGGEIIDLSDKVVLPGLIDAHVHLLAPWPDYSAMTQIRSGVAERTLWGVRNAGIYLDQGFTTVRDACTDSPSYPQFALRGAIDRGEVRGPRIIAAGQCLSVTGGHGDGLVLTPELGLQPGANVADTPDEIERVVRRDIKYGADWIKLMATGGVLDPISDYTVQEMSDEELVRAVETAHRLGRKVMVHAEGTKGILAAVRAGADSIEHGTMLDEEGAKLMVAKGTWLIPTLVCFQRGDLETSKSLPEASLRKIKDILSHQQPAFAIALKYKIPIVFGDDDIAAIAHEEFGALVRGGLTPIDAIRTATINAATMLSIPAGVIEPGRVADLVAFDADPTADITNLYKPTFVMKSGKVEKQASR